MDLINQINKTNIVVGYCLYDGYRVTEITEIHEDYVIVNDRKITYEDINNKYTYINTSYIDFCKDVELLKQNKFNLQEYHQDNIVTTDIMSYSIEAYTSYHNELKAKANYLEAVSKKALNDLEAIRSNFMSVVADMRSKVERLNQIIFTLGIYLGIDESIVQIQSGKNADGPLHLLQEKLYMDEEVGDPTDGGLSFENEYELDNWILAKNSYLKCFNYELLLPYKKCIRLIQLRREAKNRGHANPFILHMWEKADKVTYMLIRNGDNIYKISSILEFPNKLFPNSTEFVELKTKIDDNSQRRYTEKDLTSTIDLYKRNMILLQGLVDRTEIFDFKLNLLKENDESKVIFDYEQTKISDDKLSPMQWFKNAKKVSEGDRVFYSINHLIIRKEYHYYFINRNHRNEWSYPDLPKDGVYTLYKIDDHLCVKTPLRGSYKYIDGDYKYVESKICTMFKVNNNNPNDILININAVSHRDIADLDRLLHDRRDRRNYLSIVKSLLAIKECKLNELKLEEPFALLLQEITGADMLTCLDEIHWWKTKNKWKRTLEVDDIKALRMISSKLLKNG